MRTESNKKICQIARIISKIDIRTQEERAMVGALLGALFSLRKAISLNFKDRTGDNLPDDYIEELRKVAKHIELDEEIEEREWLAGYYFNSTVQRLATLNERATKYIFHQKQDVSSIIRKELKK